MSKERMLEQDLRSLPGSDAEERNRVVKSCLRHPLRRAVLNETMGESIAQDIYGMSLARVLIEPQVAKHGHLRYPVVSGRGPLVGIWMKEDRSQVMIKNAYRDSVEEEEQITVRRRLSFYDRGHVANEVNTFTIINNSRFPSLNLNGTAYQMVERAKDRMAFCTMQDETRIVLNCLLWASENRGQHVFAVRKSAVADAIREALVSIPTPKILCHPATAIRNFIAVPSDGWVDQLAPFAFFEMNGWMCPVHAHVSIPEGRIIVAPSGRNLGVLALATQAMVRSNDKREKMLTGWTCAEEIGIVMANLGSITTVHVGQCGLWDKIRLSFRRWRMDSVTEGVVEATDA
jgi:hypothetical protein